MKDLKDYRIILTIWIALGIGITGYFKIYPDVSSKRIKNPNRTNGVYEFGEPDYITQTTTSFKKYELSLLTTIVGGVLIGGIGFFTSKKK